MFSNLLACRKKFLQITNSVTQDQDPNKTADRIVSSQKIIVNRDKIMIFMYLIERKISFRMIYKSYVKVDSFHTYEFLSEFLHYNLRKFN